MPSRNYRRYEDEEEPETLSNFRTRAIMRTIRGLKAELGGLKAPGRRVGPAPILTPRQRRYKTLLGSAAPCPDKSDKRSTFRKFLGDF